MSHASKVLKKLLSNEFMDAKVYRIDMDRVDVTPTRAGGILRSLPITGDREKIKPGDPVKVLNLAGERVVMAADVATDPVQAFLEAESVALPSIGTLQGGEPDRFTDLEEVPVGSNWVYMTPPIACDNYNGHMKSTMSKTQIDLSVAAGIPDGVRAVLVRLVVSDTASGTVSNLWAGLSPTNVDNVAMDLITRVSGVSNGCLLESQGVVPCDENGDIWFQSIASGTNTMKVYVIIVGYELAESTGAPTENLVMLDDPIVVSDWYAAYKSTTSKTPIDPSSYGVPPSAKAVVVRLCASDTASSTTTDIWAALSSTSVDGQAMDALARPSGRANGQIDEVQAVVKLDDNGDMWFQCKASGTNTMRVWIVIVGFYLGFTYNVSNLPSVGPVGCRVIRTGSGQPMTSGVATPISFDTEVEDQGSCWSSSNPTRLVAPVDGWYAAGGGVGHQTGGTAVYRFSIQINQYLYSGGTQVLATAHDVTGTSNIYYVSVDTGMFYMRAGDYVQIEPYQNSGVTKNTQAAQTAYQMYCHGWLALQFEDIQ